MGYNGGLTFTERKKMKDKNSKSEVKQGTIQNYILEEFLNNPSIKAFMQATLRHAAPLIVKDFDSLSLSEKQLCAIASDMIDAIDNLKSSTTRILVENQQMISILRERNIQVDFIHVDTKEALECLKEKIKKEG